MKAPKLTSKRHEQRGSSALFFCVIILPLLFLLFVVSMDSTAYYRESQRAQKAMDDAALHAWRFLPFQAEAQAAAVRYLAQFSELGGSAEVDATADRILISVQYNLPLQFASYFIPQAVLPLNLTSVARGTPFDTYIAMDRSAYLAPTYVPPGSVMPEAWSLPEWQHSGLWGQSQFFSSARPFYYQDSSGELMQVDPQYLTQLCHNPLVTTLKGTAVAAYQYFSGFALNAVGVGAYPGSFGSSLDIIRPVQSGTQEVEPGGAAYFPFYNRMYGGDELCAAMSEHDQSALTNSEYWFPQPPANMPGLWTPPSGAPPQMIIPQSWAFDPQYQRYLQTSQVIWSRVVHEQVALGDVMLWEALAQILPVSSIDRGGLANNATKTLIVLAGDVPWAEVPGVGVQRFQSANDQVAQAITARLESDSFNPRRILAEYPELELRIIYAIVRNSALSPAGISERLSELRSFFGSLKQYQGGELHNLETQVFLIDSAEEFLRTVGGALVLEGKGAVLAE